MCFLIKIFRKAWWNKSGKKDMLSDELCRKPPILIFVCNRQKSFMNSNYLWHCVFTRMKTLSTRWIQADLSFKMKISNFEFITLSYSKTGKNKYSKLSIKHVAEEAPSSIVTAKNCKQALKVFRFGEFKRWRDYKFHPICLMENSEKRSLLQQNPMFLVKA